MIVTRSKLELMRMLYAKGYPYARIAELCGVSKGTVCYWARKDRDAFPRRTHDESWWSEMLGETADMPASVAARRIGCDRGTVYRRRRSDG